MWKQLLAILIDIVCNKNGSLNYLDVLHIITTSQYLKDVPNAYNSAHEMAKVKTQDKINSK